MKIFITGASGYIGLHVAAALRRAGHDVYGLVRSAEKSRRLALQEVHPVIGTLQEPDSFLKIAAECGTLIHCGVDYSVNTWELDKQTIERLLPLSERGSRQKTFIYTCGVWVYGSTGTQAANETTPLHPPAAVAARPANEQLVIHAQNVRAISIRPGMVYGKQGGHASKWFEAAVAGKAPTVVGDGENFWTMVHVEDLAAAYVLAVESSISHAIFNVTDRSRWRVRELAMAAAKAAGYDGSIKYVSVEEAAKTIGPAAECEALDQHVDSRKAVQLLAWQPSHGGFVDGADAYFAAWKAARDTR